MNFIILADKYQKGMKSKGCVGLIKLNNRLNVLEYQYRLIKSNFEKSKIIYVYGFDNKKMNAYIEKKNLVDFVAINNDLYEQHNYVYSLSLAAKYLEKDCFILFGDTIFKKDIFNDFNKNISQIYINKKEKNKLGCIIDDTSFVKNISFDLENYLMDIYFIAKKDTNKLINIITKPKYKNYFLFEAINQIIDSGTEFKANVKNKKNITSKINKIRAAS